jgi:hypothetical protein
LLKCQLMLLHLRKFRLFKLNKLQKVLDLI